MSSLADPAARFGGGGGQKFWRVKPNLPHFQLSPRISATLFSKHRILTVFYFMFNFYINPRPAGPLDFPPPAGGGGV